VSKLKPSRGYFSFRGFIMAEEVRDSLNSMRSPPWKNGLRGDPPPKLIACHRDKGVIERCRPVFPYPDVG
jgi:hypothetical protein